MFLSTHRAGSNLSQTIGNTEKVVILGNTFLSNTYIFNSKLADSASLEPEFTFQNISLEFVIQGHLLEV